MYRVAFAFALVVLAGLPTRADEMPYTPHRYHQRHRHYPPERHVVEVVQPPFSGVFIINGIRFTGVTPACFGWVAGDPVTLVSGDWHGHCVTATFYNHFRRNTCETLCRASFALF
jgi:hypothetical protein